MVHADHLLFDDRPLVEVGRHEVGGRADLLHAAGVGLAVGVCALEAGQERVVDVDAAPREVRAQLGGEDLHVAGEHHELHVVLGDDLADPVLEGGLVLRRGDRPVLEGDAVVLGEAGVRVVVGEDQRHLDGQVAGLDLVEQVVHAVRGLGGEHQGAHGAAHHVDAVLDVEALDDGGERGGDRVDRGGGVDLAAGELAARGDVAARREQRAGHGMDDAGPVLAHEGEDVAVRGGHGVLHGRESRSPGAVAPPRPEGRVAEVTARRAVCRRGAP